MLLKIIYKTLLKKHEKLTSITKYKLIWLKNTQEQSMLANLWNSNFRFLNLNKMSNLQNIFAHNMPQINWHSETSIIFLFMLTSEQNICPGNTNTSLSLNCLTKFDHFMWSDLKGLISLVYLEILYKELLRSQ